jgi:hypothetical protein
MVTIYDHNGRAYPSVFPTGTGRSPFEAGADEGYRLDRPRLDTEMATVLSKHKHRLLLADARYISTFPLVSGAIEQKKDYVCQAGFAPVFETDDEQWNELAETALEEAHKIVDVRGQLYTWDKAWQIGCTMLDIDGDFFVLFGQTPTGFPQIQFLEAHRVGSLYGENVVSEGEYKGRRILNGIIYDAYGKELAYRVLNSDGTYTDIRSLDTGGEMMHVCDPTWFSDGRPFPRVAYALRDWYSTIEARGYQSQKHKISAAITVVEATETGKMPEDAAAAAMKLRAGTAAAGAATAQPNVIPLDGGLIRYIKAGAGSISLFDNATPGAGWLDFDERLQRAAYIGTGWRYEMHNLAKLSGAPVRGFQDQINTTIYARWGVLTPAVYRAEAVILSKLIAIGTIPAHPQWTRYGYIPPADFTVDGGRSNAADLDNVRFGIENIPGIIGRYGKRPAKVLRGQAKYLKLKARIAAEEGVDPLELGRMDKPGQQPAATVPFAPPAPAPDNTRAA